MSFYRSCGLIQEQGSEEAAAAWGVAVGATLACDGAPPTLGDVALADGAAATESPCCSLRCSDTWYPIRGYQTNSLTTPRIGPERHALAPNAAHQARMSRTWPGAGTSRALPTRYRNQPPSSVSPRLPVLRVNWPEAGSTVEASSLNTQEHPSGVTEGGRGKE